MCFASEFESPSLLRFVAESPRRISRNCERSEGVVPGKILGPSNMDIQWPVRNWHIRKGDPLRDLKWAKMDISYWCTLIKTDQGDEFPRTANEVKEWFLEKFWGLRT